MTESINSKNFILVSVNTKRCEVQFSLIFLFFGLMGKGPGILKTVLQKKASISATSGNSKSNKWKPDSECLFSTHCNQNRHATSFCKDVCLPRL
jgi:hypothetical protein